MKDLSRFNTSVFINADTFSASKVGLASDDLVMLLALLYNTTPLPSSLSSSYDYDWML